MRIFNIVSLVVASLTILGTSTIGSVAAPQTAKGKRKATGNGKVIAYLPDWTLGDSYSVSNIPWNKTDHINYAFGSVVSATVVNGFDSSKLKQVVEAAHNNKVTVSLSVGGWSGGKEFSNIAKTASGRTNFVKTLVALVDNFGLDGLDMDWEFPASKDGMICNSVDPADSKNFVALLSQLRTALPSKILSVAAPLSPFNGPNYAPSNSVADYAAIPDMYVHLMAYDVNGDWNDIAGPNAPLYNPGHGLDSCGSDGVDAWTKAGFPANRLTLGIPFYGNTFELAGNCNALYQKNVHPQPKGDKTDELGADPCPGATKGYGGEFQWKNLLDEGVLSTPSTAGTGWVRTFDKASGTPFVFQSSTHRLITYDDPQSIKAKIAYAKSKGLYGAMIWSLDMDDSKNTLLNAMQDIRK